MLPSLVIMMIIIFGEGFHEMPYDQIKFAQLLNVEPICLAAGGASVQVVPASKHTSKILPDDIRRPQVLARRLKLRQTFTNGLELLSVFRQEDQAV